MTATPPAPFTLPAPVGAVLARLPAYPGSLLLVTAINLALAKQLPDDVKALLHGKRISIRVRDARLGFDFTWNGQRFAPSQPYAEADLTISANAQDFLLLAQRRQAVDLRARQLDTQLQLMKALGGGWSDDTQAVQVSGH